MPGGARSAALALVFVLALGGGPGQAARQSPEVWLYGDDGPYYAAGYTVAGGHVSDPLGVQIGTVDSQDYIEDSTDDVIGYVLGQVGP